MAIKKETELYEPVKGFLEKQGYTVRGEVGGCDIVAVKEENEVLIIELKKSFTLELLLQGVERFKQCKNVYVAIEKPKLRRTARKWNNIIWICKQLGLGLITIQFLRRSHHVEVVCECSGPGRKGSNQRQEKLLLEVKGRSGDYNVGGSTKVPIVTAYREEALTCAYYLFQNGPSKVSYIRESTEIEKVGTILSKNYYGWYVRKDRGIYDLSEDGKQALVKYEHVLRDPSKHMKEELD